MKKILLLFIIIALWWVYTRLHAEDLTLEITPWLIAIDGSGSINIGTISYNASPVEINQTFPINSFRMLDKRWWPGYYTTLQFGNLIQWSNEISNENIQIKTLANPNTIYGNTNTYMRFWYGIGNQFSGVNHPMTYFVRKANEGTWEIGMFGDTTDIKINVPAYQTGGTYRWAMYYTLYDKE